MYEANFYYKTSDSDYLLENVENLLIESKGYVYGENIQTSSLIPRLSDEGIADDRIRSFKGYSRTNDPEDRELVDFNLEICDGKPKNYYAVFNSESVYASYPNLDLFEFINNAGTLTC
jgi:hypothetical protein